MADAADAAPRLTSKQRAHLRSLAHALDPVVRVGKDGLTEAVIAAAEEAFNTRELLKARVLDAAGEDVRDVAHALAEQLDDVQVVQVIGHVAILYRPDLDAPQIELPR
jgi:RNA-binding protein